MNNISEIIARHKAESGLAAYNQKPFEGVLNDDVVNTWRQEFPILKTHIHVANCSQSAQSNRVRRAIEAYLTSWDEGGMDWDSWMQECYLAKAEFAKLINADPDEIAISSSVSEAISSVASALDYSGERNTVVTTDAEFPTVGHVWLSHKRHGLNVEYVPVRDGRLYFEDYAALINEKTRLASITHVYYQNGFKQDMKPVIDLCHERGALVLADVYQSIGTHPIDVKKDNIDLLVSGNLKYLFGLPGIAFIYVNRKYFDDMKPTVTGWFGQENPFSFKVRELDYAADARRMDTGTPPVINAYAVRAGMEIINEVGPENIKTRLEHLSAVAFQAADELGLTVTSPRDLEHKGGSTAILLEMNSHEMEAALKQYNIVASARGNVIRIAPHFYTKPEEIVYAMARVNDIIKQQ